MRERERGRERKVLSYNGREERFSGGNSRESRGMSFGQGRGTHRETNMVKIRGQFNNVYVNVII